ncbi:uncharacterized protein B0I36DRAFT_311790 [Microdochium trichocladiopsis]|uniref:Uncharacterized protein n=1 Tax=Microdochium trichocladiopsis TaxID=1682393 RepID=A0A9P8YJ54_9PEZI|nr:uncharacterized protein B0I36DRAFT_311790 [Microdochium trichocladiopsis]KAH7040942.1 hypothetical protein B0I36DRAFT_311790 [Microdochium trichocladiopsis]
MPLPRQDIIKAASQKEYQRSTSLVRDILGIPTAGYPNHLTDPDKPSLEGRQRTMRTKMHLCLLSQARNSSNPLPNPGTFLPRHCGLEPSIDAVPGSLRGHFCAPCLELAGLLCFFGNDLCLAVRFTIGIGKTFFFVFFSSCSVDRWFWLRRGFIAGLMGVLVGLIVLVVVVAASGVVHRYIDVLVSPSTAQLGSAVFLLV